MRPGRVGFRKTAADRPETTRCVVFVDADNTLWDTDSVFARAQLALLDSVEEAIEFRAPAGDRLAYVRGLDQALAERHHAGLRYPPRFLAKALALALTGRPPASAARLAWAGGREAGCVSDETAERIEGDFFTNLRPPPPLRPGVREGLVRLDEIGCLVLILTEGSREKVIGAASSHGLTSFSRIIEAKKERRLFRRMLRLTGNPPIAFMVGDQLERDIRPAKEAGVRTIYFPGGFRPQWEPAESVVRADYDIKSFAEVPDIVLAEM